ncbi:MAG: hypothetical protein KGL39_42855 [Patescibacteria group bacterium]|nr:hypothetical protein [Patescibacteria group bacterium]
MTQRKSPLRPAGTKPESRVAKPRPKKRVAAKPKRETLPAVLPTEPLAGFDQITASDYTQPVAGREGRYLTVSPLRAIMDEEQRRDGEHVVTERTRQGVLYGAGLGIETDVLATIYGVGLDDFRTMYASELRTAKHLMMNDVQTNLYNIARDPTHAGAVRAGMYMLGKLGNEIYKDEKRQAALTVNPTTRTVDVSLLTDDQRDALKQILTSALALAAPSGAQMVDGDYDEVDDEDGSDVL